MPNFVNREIRLKSRPIGLPTAENFELIEVALPDPAPGQMLVRNLYMSVDPYMRGRMNDARSYTPPFQVGEALTGGAVGEVIASNGGKFPVGAFVLHSYGWRTLFLSDGSGVSQIDTTLASPASYLGVMGMPGQTAYVGLLDLGKPKAGETVFVSAAAGAVGSLVCQIAKLHGCHVVGSAGSDAKVQWLRNEIGVDAAFNYKTLPLPAALARTCKEGIDIYFENVGGAHLEAALQRMNNFGRIVVCGMIANYNATEPQPGPRNLALLISKRLTMQGFIVSDHNERWSQFYADMGRWLAEGEIKWQETIVDGLENAPSAFLGLFSGENTGKMLVRLL
jgi:NADPH-dependent curcumin reductase CurA